MKPLFSRSALIVMLLLWCDASGVRVDAQQNDDADAARLVEVLELGQGATVADVGAGSGELTVRIATKVGPNGKVFSTDINPKWLQEIREAVKRSELRNVQVLEGAANRTNLPVECCDGVFVRHVYHHFGDPPAMNASLRESLKPGGRLAIVDFVPDSRVSAPPGRRDAGRNHGVTPSTVIQELTSAGLTEVQELPWSSPGGYFLVVGRRPR